MNIMENKCCGCMGCEQICPQKAINTKEDENGFLHPIVDNEKCVDCNLCNKVCISERTNKIDTNQIMLAAKNKNIKERQLSTSGGIFTVLATYILNKKGIVYGVGYNEKLEVVMKRIDRESELKKIQGVKYVQCRIDDSYKKIYDDMKNEKLILFVGTPCQCNALRNFLKLRNMPLDKIYICDLVCHGVPSAKVWKEYVKFIEREYKSKIDVYNFRYKKIGWRGHNVYIKLQNGKEVINSKAALSYSDLYSKDLIIRESCFECQFANMQRTGDITIGDCWGIEEAYKEFDDNQGVSLMILNNDKGKKLFEEVKENIYYKELPKGKCIQKNLKEPTQKPHNVKIFWREFNKKGYKYVAKKYSMYGMKNRTIFRIKNLIKMIIKIK